MCMREVSTEMFSVMQWQMHSKCVENPVVEGFMMCPSAVKTEVTAANFASDGSNLEASPSHWEQMGMIYWAIAPPRGTILMAQLSVEIYLADSF